MRPACLDDPHLRCQWDDKADHCPCHETEPEPPTRPIHTLDPGEYL